MKREYQRTTEDKHVSEIERKMIWSGFTVFYLIAHPVILRSLGETVNAFDIVVAAVF